LSVTSTPGGDLDERVNRRRAEVDDVAALRLRPGQHWSVGTFDPAGTERHPLGGEVHVVPTQTEQLRSTRTGERRQHQQDMRLRVAFADTIQQDAQLRRSVDEARDSQ
jgi:hypothetical protein